MAASARGMAGAAGNLKRLEAGTILINSAQNLTPGAAVAGAKQSGLGIEGGLDGLLQFTTTQTIHMALPD